MLYYKVIASISLILSGIWIYRIYIDYQKKKLAQLNAYITLISYIKTQIECYMMPISTIISSLSIEMLKKCGVEKTKRINNLNELLESANLIIDDDIIGLMYDFSENFGMSYMEEQIKACERVILKMITYRDEFQQKYEKDKRVSLAICMSLTLSLILVLI